MVFDDVINEPGVVQKKVANYYTYGRQHNKSLIDISQSYYDVPYILPTYYKQQQHY